MAKRATRYLNGFDELNAYLEDAFMAQAKFDAGGEVDPNMHLGFRTERIPGESPEARKAREITSRGPEYSSAPAQPLPSWAGQTSGQPASQPARTPHVPPQLALGAPMGQVSPARVTNQALSNALRAPPAPQAVGGNNG